MCKCVPIGDTLIGFNQKGRAKRGNGERHHLCMVMSKLLSQLPIRHRVAAIVGQQTDYTLFLFFASLIYQSDWGTTGKGEKPEGCS